MNKYNFIEILSQEILFEKSKYKFNGIQIPIIQRDYAHGRDGESETRKRFLNDIFAAIENNKELELDFIYGAKKSIDNKDFFVPLDGQQRLTTLFLIYWYIGNRELVDNNLSELRDILSKFSYATRNSSNKFCENISKISLSFKTFPSKEIEDATWFFDSYKLDPTVQSMLVMLDAIHSYYGSEKKELFKNLNKIKFYFLPLDGFDLTDELYIKMNARGKQLTHFENFKADLIKWLKNKKNKFKEEFENPKNYNGRNIKYNFYFELKLDNDWTNLFWNYSKTKSMPDDKIVDPYMMQFFNRYLLNSFIIDNDLNQAEYAENNIFKALYGNKGDDSKITYNNFDSYEIILQKENKIYKIEKVFEILQKNIDDINRLIKPNWNKNDDWNLFSADINQRQRIVFFATTIFLEKNNFDIDKFSNWMRIVWNIIIDPNLRSVPAMIGAIQYINALSNFSNDIINFLSKPESVLFHGNNTYDEQIKKEHHKAILFSKSIEWKNLIIDAESHNLFQGDISFMLCEETESDYHKFKRVKEISFEIFEENDLTDKPENYLWIRALLTKDIEIELPITLSNAPFSNWRYLINGSFLKPMQCLINEIKNSKQSTKLCMEGICKNYQIDPTQSWLYPLVNWSGDDGETLLGNYTETRKIQKYDNYGNDPEHVYLYNKNVWTEGNIILSCNRNIVITELLKMSSDIKINKTWLNIQSHFFRGWDIKLDRILKGVNFVYIFDRTHITVGIKYSSEFEQKISNFNIQQSDKDSGWIFKKSFEYINKGSKEISCLLKDIETEVFDLKNLQSDINKIFA